MPVKTTEYFARSVPDVMSTPWIDQGIFIDMSPSGWAKQPVKDVSTRGLIATQNNLYKKDLDRHRRGGSAEGGDLPWVAEWQGENWILDGHHRAAVAIERGQPTLRAHYVNIQPVKTAAAEILRRTVGPDPSGEQYTGVMVALVPEPELAEVLEIDGGESADVIHLTLAYLPARDDEAEWAEDLEDLPVLIQQWAEDQPKLPFRINGYGTFANEDENALWVSPDCPGLPEFRQSLVDMLSVDYHVANNHGFTPHMTVQYQDDPITEIPAIPADAQSTGPVWQFSHVWFCNGPEWTGYPLGGGMRITAGPASGRIPKAMRMLKVPFQMLRQPRPVVLDRPAQEDLEDVPQSLKGRVLDAIESVSQGLAKLEAKTRELTGAFTVRITNAWRAAFYMGVDSKFHCFWIGDHNYDEAERRFAKTAAAETLCRCCGGWGEHDTGQECYRCDGGFHVPEAEVADEPYPCDGFLGIQGSLHMAAEFNEADHPRNAQGEFAYGDGASDKIRNAAESAKKLLHDIGIPTGAVKWSPTDIANTYLMAARDRVLYDPTLFDDDEKVLARDREWKGLDHASGTGSVELQRRNVALHEIGHVLFRRAQESSSEARKELFGYLEEKINEPWRKQQGFPDAKRWELDTQRSRDGKGFSVYAQESMYEWSAEALADVALHGDNAADSSKGYVKLLRKYLPGAQAKISSQTIEYAHNRTPAPRTTGYGQDIEPHGRYLIERAPGVTLPSDVWETGSVTFRNPLHLDFGGGYGDESNWKRQLSKRYDGKTGRELSEAVKADGHDGIITHDKYGTSEIVDLTHLHAATMKANA